MKSLRLIAGLLAIASIISCDYVTAPYPKGQTSHTTTQTNVRKVLIEDYTAAQCINCPRATIAAENARNANPGKVITIGVHCSSLEAPAGQYTYDFRTVPGNTYDAFFINGDINGLPAGMVNRVSYPSGLQSIPYANWGDTASRYLSLPPSVLLTIAPNYNTGTRTLTNMTVKTKFLNSMNGTYKLTVLLTEDSIIQPQKDIDSSQLSQNCVLHYPHRYVLRDAINGTHNGWGDALTPVAPHTSFLAGDSLINTYTYVIPATFPSFTTGPALACNDAHCYVVAFLYDDVTKEILQAEEIKIR